MKAHGTEIQCAIKQSSPITGRTHISSHHISSLTIPVVSLLDPLKVSLFFRGKLYKALERKLVTWIQYVGGLGFFRVIYKI